MNKPLTEAITDPRRVPYQKAQPFAMRPENVINDGMGVEDPRVWVPMSGHTFSRPLQYNVTTGQYTHILRVTKSGVIARHRHSGVVHAWVFKGRWHYLERAVMRPARCTSFPATRRFLPSFC